MSEVEILEELYKKVSKHSNYQILPQKLTRFIKTNTIKIKRYESERLSFILKSININDKSLIDIGGNTGFFSFEILDMGAKHVDYYEGNSNHSDFVKIAATVLEINKKIDVYNEYFAFNNKQNTKKYDVALLLNVLHHIGDDYGNKNLSINNAKKMILSQLNYFSFQTKKIAFQLGYNWKGDVNYPLFKNGTKQEQINYIEEGIKDYWIIEKIGVAEKINQKIQYSNLTNENIKRQDALGEFLNRPLFILKSKKYI